MWLVRFILRLIGTEKLIEKKKLFITELIMSILIYASLEFFSTCIKYSPRAFAL